MRSRLINVVVIALFCMASSVCAEDVTGFKCSDTWCGIDPKDQVFVLSASTPIDGGFTQCEVTRVTADRTVTIDWSCVDKFDADKYALDTALSFFVVLKAIRNRTAIEKKP